MAPAPAAPPPTVVAGPLAAEVRSAPRSVVLRQRGGPVLASGTVGAGVRVRVRRAGDGVVALELRAPPGARSTRMVFRTAGGERFFGFGERSNAVDQRGREVESYVSDGPFRPENRLLAGALVPDWAERDRADATYYPVPWLLSSRGYGVLVDEDATSRFDLRAGGRWAVRAAGRRLRLRIFAGPTPARALGRFTRATGRQRPAPAPWAHGPWVQTGQPNVIPPGEERAIFRTLRRADAPVSVAETQMHYLPCGAQRGREGAERARSRYLHGLGVARLSYFNPSLCVSYASLYAEARRARALQLGPGGRPFTYTAFVGGSGPAGFTVEPLAQWDFTARNTRPLYDGLLRQAALAHGADGWMEDFGENTSPRVRQRDGSTGSRAHNRYPRDYHCAVRRLARALPKPVVRFQRSGWTGTARCADVVWGGDPTTVWGFDGLSSAVTQALSIGMSGVSRWGSDIGGYNTFSVGQRLTRELLTRWIEFGGVSGVMRTKRSGIAIPPYERPQVYDRGHIGVWRRYAKLRTQLHPYLVAADREHERTGLPLMRHLALVHPRDRRAVAADRQFLLGPDLLAAPVTAPGVRRRDVYAPAGRWLDFWRSVSYDRRTGAFRPGRPRLLRGGRTHRLPAPLGRVPLLLRAGAVVPLLPADVDTLAPYRSRGVVRLADRRDRLVLLAVPRGQGVSRAFRDVVLRSEEGRGRWTLAISSRRARRFEVWASLRTLRRPFRPRAVRVDGRSVRFRWSARTGVVRFGLRARNARVEVVG